MISARLLDCCRKNGWLISTAESCTGGLLAAALTELPGSSDVFERGFVTYSNASKVSLLAVSEATLSRYGAVSEEIAAEMALGALRQSDATISASITGIAGPGGSNGKPEGLVCFGICGPGGILATESVRFGALGRDRVRAESVEHVIRSLLAIADAIQPGP